MVEDREQFLKTMKELEPYMIEFEEEGTMRAKNNPLNCEVTDKERRPIIVITNDESTFSLNDIIYKVWTQIGNIFFRLKSRGQGITASELFFFLAALTFFFLLENQK